MDLMTGIGFLAGGAVLFWGVQASQALASFLNFHGLGIVVGGTIAACLVNSSYSDLSSAFRAFLTLFARPTAPEPVDLVPVLSALCRDARRQGLRSIQDAGKRVADDGFLARAMDLALGSGDAATARAALEREINNMRARHREIGNVFRTMAILAPMFGLLGTLIGIVSVLRHLTDPQSLGPAMAVAISSAFYGIALANLVCVPVAGKLRSRSLREMTSKEVVMLGVLDIVYSQKAPTVVELGLSSFLQTRERGPAGPEA